MPCEVLLLRNRLLALLTLFGLLVLFSFSPVAFGSPLTVVGPGIYEDDDSHLLYSPNWETVGDTKANGGTYHRSAAADETVSLQIQDAAWVSLVLVRNSTSGQVEIRIDNTPIETLDLFARQDKYNVPAGPYSVAPDSAHTLSLRVTGKKRAASGDAFVNLDQIIVGAGAPPTGTPTLEEPTVSVAVAATPTLPCIINENDVCVTRTPTPTRTFTPNPTPTKTPTPLPTNTFTPTPYLHTAANKYFYAYTHEYIAANEYFYAHAHQHAAADEHSNLYADKYTDKYGDIYTDIYRYANGNGDLYANLYGYANNNANIYGNRDRDANTNTHRDGDRNRNADFYGNLYTNSNTIFK